ncbi:MAG: long-chain fatty acid--CoA ligase [Aliidongia sp.]
MPQLWERSYPEGVEWNAPLPVSTLTAELDVAVERFGSVTFLEIMGITIDFRTFGAMVERVARGFRALGVKPGVHVALHLPNTPHYPLAFYGALRAGAVVTNLSPIDAEREIAHKIEAAEVGVVVSFADFAAKLPKDRPGLRIVLCSPADMMPAAPPAIPEDPAAPIPFTALLDPARERGEPWPVAKPDDLALLQFTGGTTGMPKAAMLTHANLTATVSIYDAWGKIPGAELHEGDERIILVLPLFHIFALGTMMTRAVRHGFTLILKPRWDTEDVLNTIDRAKPSTFSGVPTMYRAMASHPRAKTVDFSSLRYCASGGAPLPVELKEEWQKLTGVDLLEGWGMTETSPAGTGNIPEQTRFGSAGVPLPGIELQIRDLDDPHKQMPPGERGEMCIKGPNVFQGYYKQPQATAESFIDGFFRTGDIGYLDEEGFLYIVDRKKDMILSGGFNVYPRNIEEAIYEHPAVEEVIVIGIPDAYRGESAKAFITLRPGTSPFTIDELRDFLGDKLARYELPAAVEFRDVLPKTAVGKLWKKPLVDEERAKAAKA